MRKTLMFLVIFAGTAFSVFILNIMMYAVVPEYRHAIASSIESSQEIPVVTPDMVKESTGAAKVDTIDQAEALNKKTDAEVAALLKTSSLEDNEVALSATADTEKEPIVIDKEYHEDCGTGKGYWVITYSDGNVVIE